MEVTCQRCNEVLREADRFCPACGLPQLVYVEADGESEAAGAVAGPAGAARPGGEIAWREALKMTLLVGVPAGIVCSRMGALDWVLIMIAAMWVVRLYVRRTRVAGVTMRAGARIGLVTGLVTGWLVVALDCAGLWVERYVLHQGGQIDADFAHAMEPGMKMNEQMLASMGGAGSDMAGAFQNAKAMIFSAEGRAGMLLARMVISTGVMVFFAVLGGALGARLAPRVRRS